MIKTNLMSTSTFQEVVVAHSIRLDMAHFVLQHAALIARWRPERAVADAAHTLRSASNDDHTRKEADALVRLTAYGAFLNDPSRESDELRQWRQEIWRARP